jgi:ABC-2 type transport system permease protein
MNLITPSPADTLVPADGSIALRSTSDQRRALTHVLASEWIKVASLRSCKLILGSTVLVGGLVSWACAVFVTDEVQTISQVFVFSTVLTAMFAAVVGVLLFTAEVQHGTLATSLAAQPARWMLAAAKTVVAAGLGLTLGAAGMAAGVVGGALGGLEMGHSGAAATTAIWALVFTSTAAVLGLAVGMILRHGSGAISAVLIWGLVVENMLTVFVADEYSRFLPFVAGNNLLGIEGKGAFAENPALALSRPQDLVIFAAYAGLALGMGTLLLHRRDV